MYTIHKSIDISFAHHVRGHRGPCINVHGHTWKFEVGLAAETLDAEGFVIDFGLLKRRVLEPCHRLLDHALAVGQATFEEAESDLAGLGRTFRQSRAVLHGDSDASVSESPGEPFTLHGAES
ncbi:MAG: 6-carboxytetrahydropterin synthase, partial [Myxococcales bacterium]|nr:6-carboxytetrahydropterin synthase [Myxococcales bacterium]